jgi:hypothetical protein
MTSESPFLYVYFKKALKNRKKIRKNSHVSVNTLKKTKVSLDDYQKYRHCTIKVPLKMGELRKYESWHHFLFPHRE